MNLRILLVDDHEVVRRGLRALFESRAGWEVVGEAVDGDAAVEMATQLKPHVVIMDVSLSDINGLEATRRIMAQVPATEVLIFTMHKSEQLAREAVNAGAHGYVLKSDRSSELVAAVEALARHETFFRPTLGGSNSRVA